MNLHFQEVLNWKFIPHTGSIEQLLNSKRLELWGENYRSFGNLGKIASVWEEQGDLVVRMVNGELYLLTKKNMQKHQRNSFAGWLRKIKEWK